MKRDLLNNLEEWRKRTFRKPLKFLDSHPNSKEALKITENPFNQDKPIQNIPLYGLEAWLKDCD